MLFKSARKKHGVAIAGIFLLILFLTTYKAGAQADVAGTDPKIGCTQTFCLSVWKSGTSLVGRILDNFGGAKVDIDFGPVPSDAYVVVEPGSSKILVAFTDPATAGSLTDFFVDSAGQKTQLSPTQFYKAPTSTKIDAAYDPVRNSFLLARGSIGLNIDGTSGSYGTVKFFEPSGISTNDPTNSGSYNRILYNKNTNQFEALISVITNSLSQDSTGVFRPITTETMNSYVYSPVTGPTTYPTYTAAGGALPVQNFPYSEDGDMIYNSKDSTTVLVYTNNGYIFMYKSPYSTSTYDQYTGQIRTTYSTPIIRGFTGSAGSLPTTQKPSPESISSTPLSFDPVNNKYVLALSRGGIGYIQMMGSDFTNSGSEFSLGSVLSPPVIHYDASSGKHLVVYATSSGLIQTRFIDASSGSPAVFMPRAYTQPADGETSFYTVFDKTNLIALGEGSRRLGDVQATFEHPTLKSRLKGTLEFSKTDVDLTSLVIEATDTATAINKAGTKGLANKILLVPDSNNGGGVRVCPYASAVAKITENCLGELLFRGPFPETQGAVEVKAASQSGAPLAHWSFDAVGNNYQFADSKGNTPGTGSPLANGPVLADDGKFGKALILDGVDDLVTVDDKPNSALDPITGITVSAWVFLDSRAGHPYKTVLRKPPSTADDPWGLYDLLLDSANGKIEFLLSKGTVGSYKQVFSKDAIPLQTWTLVTGTWDGTTMKIFINGVLQNSAAFSGPIGTNDKPVYIGKSQWANTNHWAGKIDDVFVYNKALADAEVKELNDDYQNKIAALLGQQETLFYEIAGLSGSGAMLLEAGQSTPTPTPSSGGASPSPIASPGTSPAAQKTESKLSLTKTFLAADNKKTEVAASYKIKNLPDQEAGKGHVHAFLDGGQYIPVYSKILELKGLPAGEHKLKLELVNHDHTKYTPAASKEITFTVGSAASPGPPASPSPSPSPNAPVITITSPADKSIAAGPDIAINFDATNFEIISESIKDATCKIKYSDQRGQEQSMAFKDENYRHERSFGSPPSNIEATVACSHPTYAEQTAKIILSSGSSGAPSPSGAGLTPTPTAGPQSAVKLTNPEDGKTIGTAATFVCTATGPDLKEISLYTDIGGGSFKKYRTETVTTSPATKQFKIQDIQEGSYEWNCEAKTASGKTYKASVNRKFEVKDGAGGQTVDCAETKDCGSWEPQECPENGIQTRSCKNSRSCGYPLSRTCIYPGGPTESVPSDGEAEPRVSAQRPEGGGAMPIIIIALVVIGAVAGVLFFLKKRQGDGGSLFKLGGQ